VLQFISLRDSGRRKKWPALSLSILTRAIAAAFVSPQIRATTFFLIYRRRFPWLTEMGYSWKMEGG
jgi:hypothetical protein